MINASLLLFKQPAVAVDSLPNPSGRVLINQPHCCDFGSFKILNSLTFDNQGKELFMIRLFGFAFLLVLLAFNNQLNTRIGWSENYLTGSQWLVLIALIVVFTLTLALVGKAFDGAPNRRPIGWSTTLPLLLLVLIAFALLQLLPTVSTGIHLVPIVPWRFTSWTACSFSALLWFLLLCATTNLSGDSSNNISAVVSALLINSCLSFAEVSPNPAIDQTQSIIAASQ
ncbi:hypothetical protein OAG76_05590, partial [Rubripirellula sp.]